MEFKVGDFVRIKRSSKYDYQSDLIGKIYSIDDADDLYKYHVKFPNVDNIYREEDLEQVKKGKVVEEKPEDLVKYMAYGTGCDNRSELMTTEKELKDKIKEYSKDSSWTGRIIGYKLVPIYEAEEKTVLKMFKTTKLKKVKYKRRVGRPRKRK